MEWNRSKRHPPQTTLDFPLANPLTYLAYGMCMYTMYRLAWLAFVLLIAIEKENSLSCMIGIGNSNCKERERYRGKGKGYRGR